MEAVVRDVEEREEGRVQRGGERGEIGDGVGANI